MPMDIVEELNQLDKLVYDYTTPANMAVVPPVTAKQIRQQIDRVKQAILEDRHATAASLRGVLDKLISKQGRP